MVIYLPYRYGTLLFYRTRHSTSTNTVYKHCRLQFDTVIKSIFELTIRNESKSEMTKWRSDEITMVVQVLISHEGFRKVFSSGGCCMSDLFRLCGFWSGSGDYLNSNNLITSIRKTQQWKRQTMNNNNVFERFTMEWTGYPTASSFLN